MITRKTCFYIPLVTCILLTGCGIFGGAENSSEGTDYTTIALPPQKLTASDIAKRPTPTEEKTHTTSSGTQRNASQTSYTNSYPQRIQEDRSNGTVTEIKVDNKDLPDYYMYPKQSNTPANNGSNSNNISTPSWQISW